VHTSLPEAKSRITVFGSAILWIRPGNCSGSYIDFGNCLAASRCTFPPKDAEATIFYPKIDFLLRAFEIKILEEPPLLLIFCTDSGRSRNLTTRLLTPVQLFGQFKFNISDLDARIRTFFLFILKDHNALGGI
jgi:hypothetical protein